MRLASRARLMRMVHTIATQNSGPISSYSICHSCFHLSQLNVPRTSASSTPMLTITVMQTTPTRPLHSTQTMLVRSLERMSWVSVTGRVCIR